MVPGVLSFWSDGFQHHSRICRYSGSPRCAKGTLMTDATLWNRTWGPQSDGTTLFATSPIMTGFEPGTSEAGNRTQDLASSYLVLNCYTIWGPQSQVFLMWGNDILMGYLGRESNPGPSNSSMLALPLSHTMASGCLRSN
jgi:hypothetical protein